MTGPLGVILAGGLARRMGGGDKGLLDLGGRPVLDHVLDRLLPQVGEAAINANGDPLRFHAYDLPVIADSVADFPGPLAGVLAGLSWAQGYGASHIVTVAADTPFFPDDLVPRLLLAAETEGMPIALAASAGHRHPTFGLWPVALAGDLRAALAAGTRKIVDWTDRHGAATAAFTSTGAIDPFFNVNRPEDLETARGWLAEAAG